MVTKFFNISTDGTFADNSNILVPSQQAVRNFIASKSIQLAFMQSSQPVSATSGDKWLNTSNNLLYTYTTAWDSGVLIEQDQFFTFNDLLYYYDGSNINNYSTLSITEQNHGTQIKLWVGTREEYDELDSDEIDPNTIYRISDESDMYAVLATQTQFDNSSTTTAATPYQVNQKFGNYLSLAGGNLDAGAVLRLTNTNSEVTALGFNTSGQLTVSTDIYGNNQLDINNIVVRSGNIYKTNTSGATALWSDSNISSTQLPTASTTDLGAVKVDGTTITINNGVISASGTSALANSASGTNSLTILGTSAANNAAVNVGNLSSSGANSAALGTNATALTNSVAIGSSSTSNNKTEANATNAVAIGYNVKANANNAINVGANSQANDAECITLGESAESAGRGSIAIGSGATANAKDTDPYGQYAIAIGAHASAENESAIQIGSGTNSDSFTFQVFDYQLLDSNGTIPNARIPAATSNTLGGIMIEYDSATQTLNIKTI